MLQVSHAATGFARWTKVLLPCAECPSIFDRRQTPAVTADEGSRMKPQAVLAILTLAIGPQFGQAQDASRPIPVTVGNFARAESDLYFGNFVKESGGLGVLSHRREPASIDNQTVIRLNRDTLYSSAVFDLDAGPVTITMPDPGKRFMSLMIVNEDHYTPMVVYGKGS